MKRLSTHMFTAILAAALATPLAAQTDTTFTYQGVLKDGGQPASGTYDVTVSLWDALAGGNQVGSTVPFNGVSMTDGHFTIQLDFGADVFDNNGRWLEIAVAGTTLTPRQPITRAPYSIQTRGIHVNQNERVGIGTTTPTAPLHVTSNAIGVDTIFALSENASAIIGRTKASNGTGVFGRHDPTNNLGLLGTSNYGVYGHALSVTNDWAGYFDGRAHVSDRLFVGRETPVTSREYFGFNAPVTSGYGGMYVSTSGENALPFYGYATGGTADCWHYYDGATEKWHLSNGGERLTVQSDGYVGIGTTAPRSLLEVVGSDKILIWSKNTATSGLKYGLFGETESTSGRGVYGFASNPAGINEGVFGLSNSIQGRGVEGKGNALSGVNYGVRGVTNSPSGYGVYSFGDYGGNGAKYFVQPHPDDPSKEIRFVCLEGNESGTYFRGSTSLENGRAYIDVPEEFRLVSELDGLTVQLTARGPDAGLWIESSDLNLIVVVGNGNVEFDYFVNGVRRGFADMELVRENDAYVPEVRGVPYGTQFRPAHRQILVENGILNADFTPNEATAAMMGWTLRDPEIENRPTNETRLNLGETK